VDTVIFAKLLMLLMATQHAKSSCDSLNAGLFTRFILHRRFPSPTKFDSGSLKCFFGVGTLMDCDQLSTVSPE